LARRIYVAGERRHEMPWVSEAIVDRSQVKGTMDQLKGLMQFRIGRVKTLAITPNEKKEPTASLTLSGELTPELASIMRCREAVFREDGKPHPNIKRLDLEGILRDCMLSLPTGETAGEYSTYYPEDIASFRVEVDGMLVRLYMLVRVKGRHLELVDFLEKTNTDAFEFGVRSRQDEFNFDGKVAGTQAPVGSDNGGTAEANGSLFTGPECIGDKASCLWCERGIPKNDEGRHMHEGELVACDAKREPAIPDARSMGHGRNRKQRTRAEANQPSDAEIQKSMEAVEVVQ
jgi:hypothetical protein